MTVINGLLAFAGAFSFFTSKRSLKKITLFLVAFATGTLLGGALFHFIPESLEEAARIDGCFALDDGLHQCRFGRL